MSILTVKELCEILDDHKINLMIQKVVSSVGFYRHYHNHAHTNDQIKNRSYIVYDMTNYDYKSFTELFNDFHIYNAIENCKESSFTIYLVVKTAEAKYSCPSKVENTIQFIDAFIAMEAAVGKILKIKKLILFHGGELEW